LIKNSQPFGKKIQKTVRGIFLTYTVEIALISLGVPQLAGKSSNNVEMAKTSLHTHTAIARLPGGS